MSSNKRSGENGSHFASPGESSGIKKAVPARSYGAGNASVKKRNSPAKRVAMVVTAVIALLIVGAGVAIAMYYNNIASSIKIDEEEMVALKEELVVPEKKEDPYYILLLGSDAREGDRASRSDSIILARVDTANKKLVLISIPRDTMVQIEGHGTAKINAAYAYGGAAGAVRAVSDFAGVPITHYAEVYFDGFKDIVDAVGGVDVQVPLTFIGAHPDANGNPIQFVQGTQHMDGDMALSFSRERYAFIDGDFQRARNQRAVVIAIVKKVLKAPVTDVPNLVSELSQCITTSMSVQDILTLANEMQGMNTEEIVSVGAPGTSQMIDGASYVVIDEAAWQEMMRQIEAGEDPTGIAR